MLTLLRRLLLKRREQAQIAVLNQLARHGEMGGGALIQATGLPVGRLFPALYELHIRHLITARWDDTMPYPRRRLYRLAELPQDGPT